MKCVNYSKFWKIYNFIQNVYIKVDLIIVMYKGNLIVMSDENVWLNQYNKLWNRL